MPLPIVQPARRGRNGFVGSPFKNPTSAILALVPAIVIGRGVIPAKSGRAQVLPLPSRSAGVVSRAPLSVLSANRQPFALRSGRAQVLPNPVKFVATVNFNRLKFPVIGKQPARVGSGRAQVLPIPKNQVVVTIYRVSPLVVAQRPPVAPRSGRAQVLYFKSRTNLPIVGQIVVGRAQSAKKIGYAQFVNRTFKSVPQTVTKRPAPVVIGRSLPRAQTGRAQIVLRLPNATPYVVPIPQRTPIAVKIAPTNFYSPVYRRSGKAQILSVPVERVTRAPFRVIVARIPYPATARANAQIIRRRLSKPRRPARVVVGRPIYPPQRTGRVVIASKPYPFVTITRPSLVSPFYAEFDKSATKAIFNLSATYAVFDKSVTKATFG